MLDIDKKNQTSRRKIWMEKVLFFDASSKYWNASEKWNDGFY